MIPWYALAERADGRLPGVIYEDGLDAAFRDLAAWAAESGKPGVGEVRDLAA